MMAYTKLKIIAILLACLTVTYTGAAGAVVIEPDPDLHGVMGDLYAMSAAIRLFYDDTHKKECPALDELAHYLKRPLPDNWPSDYQTAAIQGDWWVGRKVPEFSTARKFLRDNSLLLGLYEQEGQNTWLGGAFVWMKALSFGGKAKPELEQSAPKAAQGEGGDSQHLFFNSPGTDYYWKSGLIFSTGAHAEALKKFGTGEKGPFVTPPAPSSARESISASPVEVPPDFSLGGGEEDLGPSIGGMILNPIPRQQNQ